MDVIMSQQNLSEDVHAVKKDVIKTLANIRGKLHAEMEQVRTALHHIGPKIHALHEAHVQDTFAKSTEPGFRDRCDTAGSGSLANRHRVGTDTAPAKPGFLPTGPCVTDGWLASASTPMSQRFPAPVPRSNDRAAPRTSFFIPL